MKKLLSLIMGILLVITLIPLASSYVNDRRNITIFPIIDGKTSTGGFIASRIDSLAKNLLGKESGFLGESNRPYMAYNMTKILNNSKIESIYLNLTSVNLDAWDNLDNVDIIRLNNTRINAINPNAILLNDLIVGGNIYTATDTWSANTQRQINIDSSTLSWSDIYNQTFTQTDGFFSLGINFSDSSNDEFIYFNATEGSTGGLAAPKLIMQVSCLPPTTTSSTYEWIINSTCIITDENITANKNLTIQDSGKLILNGSTILNMSSQGAYIKLYSGGRLTLGGTAKYIMR